MLRFASGMGLLVAVAVAGCGASSTPTTAVRTTVAPAGAGSRTTPAHEDTGRPATTAPGETATTAPSRPTQLAFDYTNAQGWHYAGTIPLPTAFAAVSKDISSSPPGRAKVTAILVGSLGDALTFTPDNPGRPNGPALRVLPFEASYRLPTRVGELMAGPGPGRGDLAEPQMFGPCLLSDDQYRYGVVCRNLFSTSGLSGTSDSDGPEAPIDSLVAALKGQKPSYVLGWGGVETCKIFVLPSGTVKTSKLSDCLGKVTVTAS